MKYLKYCSINKRSKGTSEVSEVSNIVPIINKGSKAIKWCLWLLHNTVCRVMFLMSEVLKVYCTLYTVASHPCQEGRLFEPSVLGV